MKTIEPLVELNDREMRLTTGGDFAYDFGFFVRELVIYTVNGGLASGTMSAAVDFGVNYRPLH